MSGKDIKDTRLRTYNYKSHGIRREQIKETILATMSGNYANIAMTCRDVGINRVTFYNYYRNDPEFKSKIDALREVVPESVEELKLRRRQELEWVELKMFKRIEEGSDMLIKFFLERAGRDYGYGEVKVSAIAINIDLKETRELVERYKAEY